MSTSAGCSAKVCSKCGKGILSLSQAKYQNGLWLCSDCWAPAPKVRTAKEPEYEPTAAEKKIFYDTLASLFNGAKILDSIYWDAERLTKDGKYRYYGIAKTLEYVARIKGMPIDLTYGLLTLIPRFYQEANAYWGQQKTIYDANMAFQPKQETHNIVISEEKSKEIFKPKTNIEEL